MATATAARAQSSAPNLAVLGDSRLAPSPNDASSAKEYDLVQYCRTLVRRSRDYQQQLRTRWKRNYQILHNNTFTTRHPYMPTTEIPEIWPVCASIVGWMTDTRPQFNIQPIGLPFSPYASQFQSLADDLNVAINAAWTMHDYDATIERVSWDTLTYGIGIYKTVWDSTLLGGMGNPRMSRVDPFHFFPDPNAHDTMDGEYYGEVYVSSIQALDRRFPGAAKKIRGVPVGITEQEDDAPTRAQTLNTQMPRVNPGALAPATATRYGLPGQGTDAITANHMGVTVIEMWLRTHEYDKDTQATIEDWRYVVIAGDTVITDHLASTFTESRRHPYERYVLLDEGEFYGQSTVELLAPLQLSLNRLFQHTEHNIWLTGNPILKESNRAGTSRQNVSNRSGQRVRVNEGAEFDWMRPPVLDASLVPQLMSFILGRMEAASGLSAINRGNIPGGRNAQGVMDSVAESSFVRVRISQRQLERVIGRCGELIASYITEYYDEPRLLAISGPDTAPQTRIFKTLHFYSPQAEFKVDGSATEDRAPLRFHLQVDAGSSLPTSRGARAAEADTLYAMGAIDIQAVLEAHKWPGRDAIAKRQAYAQATGMANQPNARTAGRA